MGVHYDGLAGYTSYDLQWLGPIAYPLSLAAVAQALVFYDMVRQTCRAHLEAEARSRPSACWAGTSLQWLVPRSARIDGTAAPPDARVTLLVLIVMLSEVTFAVLCLVQCSLNFATRSFPGGSGACDFQAFYATYYTFSSIGTFALATLFGARATITGGDCPLFRVPIIAAAGVAVHGGALLIAALPLLGAGEYLFATDYCQYNVEGSFASIVFVWLVTGLLVTTGSAVAVALTKPSSASASYTPSASTSASVSAFVSISASASASASCHAASLSGTAQPPEVLAKLCAAARRLFAACALYYAAAWLTTLVVVCLYWSHGSVFDSPQWRV